MRIPKRRGDGRGGLVFNSLKVFCILTFEFGQSLGSFSWTPGSGQAETFRKTEPRLAASPLPPGSWKWCSLGRRAQEEED